MISRHPRELPDDRQQVRPQLGHLGGAGDHHVGRRQREGRRGKRRRAVGVADRHRRDREDHHLRHGHGHRQCLHLAHRRGLRADAEEGRAEQQIAHREIDEAQSDERRPAERRRRQPAEPARRPQRDRRKDRRRPHRDPDQRHRQHRQQLAEEDRIDRHRGGQHFDHLVRFLLDHLAEQQAGEQDGQQEQQALADPRGVGAGADHRPRRLPELDDRHLRHRRARRRLVAPALHRPAAASAAAPCRRRRPRRSAAAGRARLRAPRSPPGCRRRAAARAARPHRAPARNARSASVRPAPAPPAAACGRRRARRTRPQVATTAMVGCWTWSSGPRTPVIRATIRIGNNGPTRNSRKVRENTVAVKSRRAMTKAPRSSSGIFMAPFPSRPPPPGRRWRRRRREAPAARSPASRSRRRRRSAP